MNASTRSIVLWIVLIGLFVFFYQFFGGGSAAQASSPPREVDWSRLLTWVPMGIILVGFMIYSRIQQQRYVQTPDALQLFFRGRYAEALELFEKYRREHPKDPVCALNTATTRLKLWKLDDARRELEETKTLVGKKPRELAALLPEHLALTHALLGNVGDARRWLAEVPADKADPARVNLVTAILLAREGDWASARTKLASFEVKQMHNYAAFARTLEALCIEQLTGERRHVDRLAAFGPAAPDELERSWPEFVAFVERAPAW